jgi:hypothetical protein
MREEMPAPVGGVVRQEEGRIGDQRRAEGRTEHGLVARRDPAQAREVVDGHECRRALHGRFAFFTGERIKRRRLRARVADLRSF